MAKSARRKAKNAVTSVPVFIERDKTWQWFAIDSLRVKRGSVTGILHREDGPAVEWADGMREWWDRGQLHREGEPAVEYVNGMREWWDRGQLHREDGPAFERIGGTREWWIRGERFRDERAWKKALGAKRESR